ncbi:MAG TPA: cyclic nucleotide-binding domain-containing protein [Polyangiaceae bacterium]|nr:cyclic nucleotide-binding domain-containing protein [Polyangiaceae bacterium]
MLVDLPLPGVRDRVLLLRSLESFAALDEEGITLLAEHARPRAFRPGEVVFVEGRPVESVHVVIDGQISSRRRGKLLAQVRRARGVGFLSLLARDENGVDAVADEPTHTLEVAAAVVHDMMEENFSFLRNLLRLSARGLLGRRGGLPANPDAPPAAEIGEYPARTMTLVERVLDLRSGGIFATGSLEPVVELARRQEQVEFAPGELLWRAGEPSSWSLRVLAGRIECTGAGGRRVVVGQGYVLGNLDALAEQPRSFEARAETRVAAYRSDLEALLAVMESHPGLGREMLGVLSRFLLEA